MESFLVLHPVVQVTLIVTALIAFLATLYLFWMVWMSL